MQLFNFIFVQRNWTVDKAHMCSVMEHYVQQRYPVQLLIFPGQCAISYWPLRRLGPAALH